MTNKNIDVDDLDDIIGIAERLQEEDTDKMSFEEIAAVAKELDISVEYLQKAIDELKKKRLLEEQESKKQTELEKTHKTMRTKGTVFFIVVGLVSGFYSYGSLTAKVAEVELHHSNVAGALERQKNTEKRYKEASRTAAVDAELDGAENRVRIAQQRYDRAASQYNSTSLSMLHRPWVSLLGFPSGYQLSSEKESW